MSRPLGSFNTDPTEHVGEVYAELTLVEYVKPVWLYSTRSGVVLKHHIYRCRCSCGRTTEVYLNWVQTGAVRHCGNPVHWEEGPYSRSPHRRPAESVLVVYDRYEDLPPPSERILVRQQFLADRGAELRLDRPIKERISTTPIRKMRPVVMHLEENGVGMRFGILTIIEIGPLVRHFVFGPNRYPTSKYVGAVADVRRQIRVRCDCGTELTVTSHELITHRRKSCGCAANWSDGALMYAQQHPGLYRDEAGGYRDADGFLVMIHHYQESIDQKVDQRRERKRLDKEAKKAEELANRRRKHNHE